MGEKGKNEEIRPRRGKGVQGAGQHDKDYPNTVYMKRRASAEQQHISIELDVTRQEGPGSAPRVQRILYETDDVNESVATALKTICDRGDYRDIAGKPVGTISWENSCLQKKCGACAMVIDGKPALACGTLLRDHLQNGRTRKKPMTIAPLSKFPVIRDLMVDRHILFDNLKTFGMWENQKSDLNEKKSAVAYEASRCLQCGCCLEVCPNFAPGEAFFGAAGFVPASRLLSAMPREDRERIRRSYMEHEYSGCGKSLACMDICPAQIDIEKLLIHSAAATIFNR